MRNKCVSTPCRPVRRLLALACLLLLLPVVAMAQHRQENSPIEYYGTDEPDGYVWNAPLTYLARPDHAQALTDLVVRQYGAFREQDFEDELVKSAGGDSVCALYRAAQSNGWRASPPPASLVPVANRRVLTAVVAALWDEYGPKTPRGHEVNGRWLPVPWVYTPVELAAQRYFDKWYALMRSSIGMPHILSMQMPKPPARGYPPPPAWFVRAVKTMHPALPRLNAKRRPGKKGA